MRHHKKTVIDFGNVFHFGKDRPRTLNNNIQITNLKQYTNPNIQNLKRKKAGGAAIEPASQLNEEHDGYGQSRKCCKGNDRLYIEEQGEKWSGDNDNAETKKPLD